jgi:hypothetical protein
MTLEHSASTITPDAYCELLDVSRRHSRSVGPKSRTRSGWQKPSSAPSGGSDRRRHCAPLASAHLSARGPALNVDAG